MALSKKGKYSYGESQLDLQDELLCYSKENGYPVVHFADAVCICGGKVFNLFLDDTEGAAVRICTGCGAKHPIGDSEKYLEKAELEECECPCGFGEFEITAGVALYQDSEDVKWLYIGCRCAKCSLTACYGDWKNEYIGFRDFLNRIQKSLINRWLAPPTDVENVKWNVIPRPSALSTRTYPFCRIRCPLKC